MVLVIISILPYGLLLWPCQQWWGPTRDSYFTLLLLDFRAILTLHLAWMNYPQH